MAPDPRNLICSGVEPVDTLQGGLTEGALYLVHGSSQETSLFAYRFLIEGLKRGERAALVMNYSPEEAVRHFSLLGYDCLEDVYSGRLVVLEYTEETIHQIAALSEFSPVLRELEWLLGETKPARIVLDPITTVLARRDQHLASRCEQFVEWASGLGGTVLLIASVADPTVTDILRPLVSDSFRFQLRNLGQGSECWLVFEKSDLIADVAVEVDASRGIFVSNRAGTAPHASEDRESSATEPPATGEPRPTGELEIDLPPTIELEAVNEGPLVDVEPVQSPFADSVESSILSQSQEHLVPGENLEPLRLAMINEDQASGASDEFGAFLREVMNAASTLDLSYLDREPQPLKPTSTAAEKKRSSAGEAASPVRARAADAKIDAASASRTAETLLQTPTSKPSTQPESRTIDRREKRSPKASDFNVLIVTDDQRSRELILHSLSEYSTQIAQDGISALARLISFKPDLVVLDADLPVLDGFKVLEHIRGSLDVPVILVSGSRLRASDRVMSSELGADYFLTKPFSAKELSNRARQLIARHRRIDSWILTSRSEPDAARLARKETFTSYQDFAAEVEKRVEAALRGGSPFSVVGCRLPGDPALKTDLAPQLFGIVHELARETDLTTSNAKNDLLVLLPEANASGARAFASRLRAKLLERIKQEPEFWIKTFPDSALAARAAGSSIPESDAQLLRRRATDHSSKSSAKPSSGESGFRPSAMTAGGGTF